MLFLVQIILFVGCSALLAAIPIPNEAGRLMYICGSTGDGERSSGTRTQLNRTITFLKLQTLRAANSTSMVATQYTNNGTERIFDENIHHVGGLEMENITNAMPQNISTVLVEDYRVLSTAYAYWDNMVKDETEYEEGRFKMEMTAGLNKIRDVLCTLCSALQDTIECVVERSAMPDDVRNVSNRTLRFERDYDVARNTTEILKLMSRRYDSISSH